MFKYDLSKMVNKIFGQLTVLEKADTDPKWKHSTWLCKCACGEEKIVRGAYLRTSKNPSCGCAYVRAVSAANKKYNTLEDYLSNTKKNGDCLEWQGHKTTAGYGFVGVYVNKFEPKKSGLVHRRVYELVTGKSPDVVMHTCDNRGCVNPKHLVGGSQSDNIKDAHTKKRMYWDKQGESNG